MQGESMNFISDNTESPQVSMLENIFLFIGLLAVVFVLSAIGGLVYALAQLCKPESLCAFYQWFGGVL